MPVVFRPGHFLARCAVRFTRSRPSHHSLAQLNGTVLDTSGRAVVGASITLRSLDTNQLSNATTNTSGFYVLPSLSPGHYDLTASYSGFARFTQTGIALTVGQTATINITLKVASAGETIIVTTEAPVIETTRTEVSQVIDTKQIADLPDGQPSLYGFRTADPWGRQQPHQPGNDFHRV